MDNKVTYKKWKVVIVTSAGGASGLGVSLTNDPITKSISSKKFYLFIKSLDFCLPFWNSCFAKNEEKGTIKNIK